MTPSTRILDIKLSIRLQDAILYEQGFDHRFPGFIEGPIAWDAVNERDRLRVKLDKARRDYLAVRQERRSERALS